MNNSTVNTESLVQQINDEKAQLLIPATVYICVLMITGIVGNMMVCFYYCFKTKQVPTSIFIITLCVYDLTVCFISMPTEIVDIVKFYTFTNGPACKFLRFVNYFAAIASSLTLVMIAVERYRHICRSVGIQMMVKNAKIYCLILAGFALFLSWPSLVIYDAVKVPIPNTHGLLLEGSDCTSRNDNSYKPYVWAFNGVHFVLFIVFSIILIVLYTIIGRTIYKHRQNIAKYKITAISSQQLADSENDQEMSNTTDSTSSGEHNKALSAYEIHRHLEPNCTHPTSSIVMAEEGTKDNPSEANPEISDCIETKHDNINHSTEHKPKSNTSQTEPKLSKNGFDRETIRMTLLMFAVTVLFIFSFLPYLSLIIWRNSVDKHETEFLSDSDFIAFEIGARSFLLNSSLNPWIYGIFNSKFRQYYYNLLCCKKL